MRGRACDSAVRSWLVPTALMLLLSGCVTVPITGRTQLNMISDQQLAAAADQDFAKFASLVVQKNAALSPSESPQAAALMATINRVSGKIINAAGLRGRYNWQTLVVKSREANAFVMPNGKIVVFTGIIPIASGLGRPRSAAEEYRGLAGVYPHFWRALSDYGLVRSPLKTKMRVYYPHLLCYWRLRVRVLPAMGYQPRGPRRERARVVAGHRR